MGIDLVEPDRLLQLRLAHDWHFMPRIDHDLALALLRKQALRDGSKGHANWDPEMESVFEFVRRRRLPAHAA